MSFPLLANYPSMDNIIEALSASTPFLNVNELLIKLYQLRKSYYRVSNPIMKWFELVEVIQLMTDVVSTLSFLLS